MEFVANADLEQGVTSSAVVTHLTDTSHNWKQSTSNNNLIHDSRTSENGNKNSWCWIVLCCFLYVLFFVIKSMKLVK